MRLSTRGEYGLLALVELAMSSKGRALQAKRIAERQGIPKQSLDQLMMDLKKAGLVVSLRGRQGGYQLARPANSISLWEACHTLDTSLKPSFSSAQWTAIVKQMQAMAGSHLNDKDVQSVLEFLNYDETHRKAALKSQVSSAASGSIAAGQEFYSAQGCDTCHSIAGKGGNMGPTLNGVGAKLSRDQIAQIVRNGKDNTSMPDLPSGTTDQQINDLVDFLLSLK
jgi:Rrf2 family protein